MQKKIVKKLKVLKSGKKVQKVWEKIVEKLKKSA